MSPFEVLYGQKCHTPSSWGGLEDRLMLGLKMFKDISASNLCLCLDLYFVVFLHKSRYHNMH